ncbi:MAG: HNH endonuclease [Spirochaetia bacterium]|jgi:5-methylcytosine-specific restriction endonuclease McrA
MPDREVTTIEELIFYQYAKVMAHSAFGSDAKSQSYGFIKQSFRDLKEGRKKWSNITREDKQFIQTEKVCLYCGASQELQWEHVVPKSILIFEKCSSCERVQGIHNQVWACPKCNHDKHDLGLYTYFQKRLPRDKKFYDRIPPLLEKKYLKTIYFCHKCAGTLESGDLDGDGLITVLDIDKVLQLPKSELNKPNEGRV